MATHNPHADPNGFAIDVDESYYEVLFSRVPVQLSRMNLHFEDLGVITWLLSHKPGLRITESFIVGGSPAGRDKVRAILRRLSEAGVIQRFQVRDEQGKMRQSVMRLMPVKAFLTDDGKPVNGDNQAKQGVPPGETVDGKPVNGEPVNGENYTKGDNLKGRSFQREIKGDQNPFSASRRCEPTLFGDQASSVAAGSKDEKIKTGNDSPEFLAFWDSYPLKKAKGGARASWAKVLKAGVEPSVLIAAASAYASWARQNPQRMIKHPTTWLNQECWEDDLSGNLVASNGKGHVPFTQDRNIWNNLDTDGWKVAYDQ